MQIMPLEYSGHHIRAVEQDGQMWWPIVDVCQAIGHKNNRDAAKLVENECVEKVYTKSPNGKRVAVLACNEPGLYQLLLRSSVPGAKPFQKWVTAEVLPTIRKTGSYSVAPQPQAPSLPNWAEQLMQAMGGTVIALQQQQAVTTQAVSLLEAKVEQIDEQVESRIESLPSRVALQVKQDLQALDQRKVRLKTLVGLIVKRAKDLPPDHGAGKHFRSYSAAYNAVFAAADPPVSKLATFTTKAQIHKAIEFAEMQLTMLGATVPSDQQELLQE